MGERRPALAISPSQLWPYNTIALSQDNSVGIDDVPPGNCTATLIGSQSERHIITAAHCFWTKFGNYIDLDYVPRKDGCEAVPGWPLVGCDKSPYGKYDGWVWMMPQAFVDNCVGYNWSAGEDWYVTNFTTCRKNDIAIQHVVAEGSPPFPGAMGFGAYSDSQLRSGFISLHRGYPHCSEANAPSNCRVNTLYGQDGGTTYGFFNGRWFSHNSDSSPGHSGGPFYLYDGLEVYVLGVDVGIDYSGPVATPFHGARIDGQFFGWMLDFMNL